jgi:hypothetical protein
MNFAHPLLLGGLALVAVPLVIHLLMRQKPKRLPFPAFRFLLQKQRTNQTRLRLRHLLLLLLRMAIIAALCLALAGPKQEGGPIDPLGGQPVAAVLLVDTSYSMEYAVAGQTRLEEAKRRGQEFLDELPEGSRIAILDSADSGGEWSASLPLARERLAGLKLRHDNAALPRQIEQGYRLLADLPREQESAADALPRVLCVVSDRTVGCWDEALARTLTQPADVSTVFIDVGAEKPTDLSIVEVKPEVSTVRPGEPIHIDVTVQATGADFDTQISCLFDGVASVPTQPLKIESGRSQVVRFEQRAARSEERDGLGAGLHQVEVHIGSNDALPFNNAGFATFRVLEARGVLVLTDDSDAAKSAAQLWARLFVGTNHPDIRTQDGIRDLDDLRHYQVVTLVNMARPNADLWKWLHQYVSGGGGVLVVPGGEGWRPDAYQTEAALTLLPGKIKDAKKTEGKKGGFWYEFEIEPNLLTRHPLLAPFLRWKNQEVDFFEEGTKARAYRFWQVDPLDGATVLTRYTTDRGAGAPALLERTIERGRVVLLTTPYDRRTDETGSEWNNYFYLNSSFGFVLPNAIVSYLAGDAESADLTFVAGQTVSIPAPNQPILPSYQLSGPGIAGNDAVLPRAEGQKDLRIAHAVTPGNYTILANDGRTPRRVVAFSIIPRPDEYLLDRVPVEQIEERLGKDSVLPLGRKVSLRERLERRWTPPLEWAPWLLMLLLLVLAIEPLVANRFYRRRDDASSVPSPAAPTETRHAEEPVGVPGQ